MELFLLLTIWVFTYISPGIAQEADLIANDLRDVMLGMANRMKTLEQRVDFLEERNKQLELIEGLLQTDDGDGRVDIVGTIRQYQTTMFDMEQRLTNMESTVQNLNEKLHNLNLDEKLQNQKEDDNGNVPSIVTDNMEKSSVKDDGVDGNSRTGMTGYQNPRIFNTEKRAVETTKLAFTAALSGHIDHLGVHQTILFDRVITNLGNAYNKNTGLFHVPVSGFYVISLTFNPGDKHVPESYLEIVQDGSSIADIIVDNNVLSGSYSSTGNFVRYTSASTTWVFHLTAGSDVWVRTTDYSSSTTVHSHTLISGWLLYND